MPMLKNFEQIQWNKIFCRMYGLAVIEVMSLSRHLLNIDEMSLYLNSWHLLSFSWRKYQCAGHLSTNQIRALKLCFDWVKLSKNQNFCCMVVQSYDDTKEQSWKVPLISEMVFLTPNRPLIQLWCARSKLNMDEIYSLNIHL